jgi:hydroxysqualene dehydroxylase
MQRPMKASMNVLIVGAGWAGLAAAVHAARQGHRVTLLEASRTLGGRARAVQVALPDGREVTLDNGQHILIGAYSQTLQLMRDVGVDLNAALLRIPLTLRYPDGGGLQLPDWQRPWVAGLDVAVGILQAKGWSWRDKFSLLRAASRWQRAGFTCPADWTVAQLCQGISPRVMAEMIEPLVVSALNIPASQASASVYLRVIHDALFAAAPALPASPASPATSSAQLPIAGSNMLLPRCDLSALMPQAAAQWLVQRGARVLTGVRLSSLDPLQISELLTQHLHGLPGDLIEKTALKQPAEQAMDGKTNSNVNGDGVSEDGQADSGKLHDNQFDHIVLATPAWEAARLVRTLPRPSSQFSSAIVSSASSSAISNTVSTETAIEASRDYDTAQAWADTAAALQHTAIATVYAYSAQASLQPKALSQPVLALRSSPSAPAQFVFDRGQLSKPLSNPMVNESNSQGQHHQNGILAFVVSASVGDAATIEQQVITQGRTQLGLPDLQPLKTIIEKRATFACTPTIVRPVAHITQNITACGDYIDGPYPATLEASVRNGLGIFNRCLIWNKSF